MWAQSLCSFHLFWGFILHLEVLEVEEPKPIASNGRQTAKYVKVSCSQKQSSQLVQLDCDMYSFPGVRIRKEIEIRLKQSSPTVEKYKSTVWKDGFHTKSTREQRSYLMFAVVKSVCNGMWRCSQKNLRIKKRASGAFSPDIDPYSRETKETSIDKPIRMSRYLEWESQKVQI